MDSTVMLLLLVVVMLVGSYLAGSIPLNVNMSEDKLKKVTVLGAGLLVGTALAVIIPEGVSALLSMPHQAPTPGGAPSVGALEHHDHDHAEESNLHAVIGISLVLGFVFMLLVDQISSSMNDSAVPAERNVTATIGLVVHAAADGIALGAAASTAHADVEIIVFVAIMLHKAPAAFGLVTFLLHEGIERNRIRKHLLIFSCSAPLLTVLTYFGLGQEGKDTLSSVNATGIAMLFSAGTFLYVATVHVLPELMQEGGGHGKGWKALPGGADEVRPCNGRLRPAELILLVVGALMPLLLTAGHHH